jgi:Amino acid synthesis
MTLRIRKLLTAREETRLEGGRADGIPLVKAAAMAVIANPYAGGPFADDLSELVDTGTELGTLLGETAAGALGTEVQSYGKAALVGLAGEQEHAVAAKIGAFGTAVRDAVGDATAWISSVSKRCAAGTPVDVPLASKDDIWVRSHYDAFTVVVPDAPLPDEIVVIIAVASRGRLHERVGGMTREEALRS